METMDDDIEGFERLVKILEMPEKDRSEYIDKRLIELDKELKDIEERKALEAKNLGIPEKEILEDMDEQTEEETDEETEDMSEELKAMIENENLETSEKEIVEDIDEETEDMDEELKAILESIEMPEKEMLESLDKIRKGLELKN